MKRTVITLICLPIVVATTVVACGSSHDSSPDPGGQPGTRQAVIQMPSGFRNVAFSCHGTTGVYVTSHAISANNIPSGIAVLANDPACK